MATAPGGAGQGGAVEQAKDTARHLAGQAKEQTTQRVQSGLMQGKTRAASSLGAVAETLRQSTQQLRDQNQAGAGQYVERAADQVQRLSDYLQNTDVHDMVDSVERVARRQPALFLGSAFALGLLGARFLKNTRRGQADERYGQRDQGSPGVGAYAGGYGGPGAYGAAAGGAAAGGYGATTGSAYGGASSLDRAVTGSPGLGAAPLGDSASASGGSGTGGAGLAGGADRAMSSGLGSSLGGAGGSAGVGTPAAPIDPNRADRPL